MTISTLLGTSPVDSDYDVEEILKQHDTYIVNLARKKVPRNVVRTEMLRDEIDELAQKVRFKLWLTLRKKHVKNLKAYIRCIVYTEVIDMVRHYQPTLPLPLNDDDELQQGNMMIPISRGIQDPALEAEQEEAMDNFMKMIIEDLLRLPSCQQRAMICLLKDQLDDLFPLIDALREHEVDIEKVNWPEAKDELRSLRSSLSVARKKLRSSKSKYCLT